jgi:Protein of unknown function (DUF2971)
MLPVMRAYKFLCRKYGLQSLREKRLKQSTVNNLNDPFELMPYDVTDPLIRKTFLATRDNVHDEKGVLCFSADWNDPVIWAHYSDKHYGLCLGFEIPDIAGDLLGECDYVKYIADPLYFNFYHYDGLDDEERSKITRKVLFSKYKHWQYEHEIRCWATLEKPEKSGLSFVNFSDKLKLVEVIFGARCDTTRAEVIEAIGPAAGEVKMIKARAAYDRFQMVEDEAGPK